MNLPFWRQWLRFSWWQYLALEHLINDTSITFGHNRSWRRGRRKFEWHASLSCLRMNELWLRDIFTYLSLEELYSLVLSTLGLAKINWITNNKKNHKMALGNDYSLSLKKKLIKKIFLFYFIFSFGKKKLMW